MGVAWVFESKQNARSVELAFEQSGAVLQGVPKTFRVDCTWFRPSPNLPSIAAQINNIYLLHHSHFPDSSFAVSKYDQAQSQQTPARSQRSGSDQPKATADQGFELILGKFASAGLASESPKFELVGNEYYLKDFRLRVGNVSHGPTFKGVVVEVEYAPSNVVVQCSALLQELIDLFFPGGQAQKKPEIFSRHTQPDNYMAIDTLAQYLDIFLAMQKKS